MVTKVDAAAEISNEEAAIVKEDVVEFSKEEAERETEAVDIFIVEETAGVTDAVLDISNEEAAKSTEALEETEMTDIYEASELATVELIAKTFVVKLDVVVVLTATDRILDISNEEAARSTEALEETGMTDIYEAFELATVEALVVTVGSRRSDEVKFNDFDGRTWTKEAFAMRVKFTVT